MLRLMIYAVLAVSSIIVSFFISDPTIVNMTAGLGVGFFVPVVDEVARNWGSLRYMWYSVRYRSRTIRVSTSYLFKIYLDGKYLLVRGGRYHNQFQPVGGVHKVTPQGSAVLSAMGVTDDDLLPVDAVSYGDLRVRIPGKKIFSFFRWFDSRSGREDSPWREFQEEMIATGILPQEEFPHIMHNYLRRESDPIRYSEWAESLEILVRDVYELVPSRDQEIALRRLMASDQPDVVWVTAQQIKRRGAAPGQPHTVEVSAHSRAIL